MSVPDQSSINSMIKQPEHRNQHHDSHQMFPQQHDQQQNYYGHYEHQPSYAPMDHQGYQQQPDAQQQW